MAEIINLNKAKKARARAQHVKQADLNRAKHGQTKDERSRTEAEQDQRDHTLDNARIDDEPDGAA